MPDSAYTNAPKPYVYRSVRIFHQNCAKDF